jgi:hypothetical protein
MFSSRDRILRLCAVAFVAAAVAMAAAAPVGAGRLQRASGARPEWRFAVSGDSRNCGDVVMPAIARRVIEAGPAFYWHLGDFRAIYTFDEDIQGERQHAGLPPLTISEYESLAWDDFIANQVGPFGSLPVFLGIGNHELIPPKTRDDYLTAFADWLGTPAIRGQRLADDPADHGLEAYYHWIDRGVDFIALDNGSLDQFDAVQMAWLRAVLARDVANRSITTIVVGSHRALPDSLSAGHSMNESPAGEQSGRLAYAALLEAHTKGGKQVYLIASHSHLFMQNVFDTERLRANGGVLPGWIVGTGGALRYPLPTGVKPGPGARTNVYGYLLATVVADGRITFEFRQVAEQDVPERVVNRYGADTVRWCFEQNSMAAEEATAGRR